MIDALLRLPALHFALIGALLFVATTDRQAPGSSAQGRVPIVIDDATVEALRQEHLQTMDAPPTDAELHRLIEREIDREILYREALLLGLDRADPAVDRRVIEKVRFLDGEAAGTDAEALQRGIALGLDREDVVVRRTLVTKMQLLTKRASRLDEPTGTALDRALQALLDREPERYRQPGAVTLRHLFFSSAERGPDATRDARALRQRLQDPPNAEDAGDPFPLGHEFRHQSRQSLAKIFGPEFAAAALALEPGTWSEPIASAYGVHLVLIIEKTSARTPALSEVRSRVLRMYRAERHEAYLRKSMASLREVYEIRLPDGVGTDRDA